MVPVNMAIAKKSRQLNKVQMGNKDARTKLMDEVLNGMKVIKLYAWEKPFLEKNLKVRDVELSNLKKILTCRALHRSLGHALHFWFLLQHLHYIRSLVRNL
jgi:hypothetical protein